MQTEHLFARDDVLPSWWANLVGTFLGLLSSGFTLTKQDDTHIEVVAGADDAAAVISVHGRWRWVEATVVRAHPGGVAGTYDIFVTAKETNIVGVPAPYTDDTDYSWALAIVAHGATPPVVAGVVDVFRKVGELQWDGLKITRIDQLVPSISLHAHTHAPGGADPLELDVLGVEELAHKDQPNGYAGLDGAGKLHPAEMPEGTSHGATGGYSDPAGGSYVTVDGMFDGGLGGTGYTLTDMCAALKEAGILPP